MIRWLAWCGTNTSTSATVRLVASSTRRAESTDTVVANLYTCGPVHLDVRRVRAAAVTGGGHLEQIAPATVGTDLEAEQPVPAPRPAEHHRAGAVAEQDAGRAIAPVEQPREHLGADHQRRIGQSRLDLRVGLRQRVDEPAAGGGQVEGGDVVGADLLADQRRGGGEVVVGAGRGGHDQVDLIRLDTRRRQARAGPPRRRGRPTTRPRRRSAARGSPCAGRSTRRRSRPSSRSRRWA